ncbi:MAG: hypothetical protein JNL70_11415 [Saprospiraceae bacterium]|nr:hypothetical protein [Saprospiraceae bacterium]
MKNYLVLIFSIVQLIIGAQNTTVDVKITTLEGDILAGKLKNYPTSGWE